MDRNVIVRRGTIRARAKPALVIFVRPGTLLDWKKLDLDLRGMFPASLDVKMEFLPGASGFLADAEEPEEEDHGDTDEPTEGEIANEMSNLTLLTPSEDQGRYTGAAERTDVRGQKIPINSNPGLGCSIGISGERAVPPWVGL